jgi:hypothetical protein
MGHERAGGYDGFHYAGIDEVAKHQTHFADGQGAGQSHDHETIFVSRHGFENVSGVAHLAGGKSRLAHAANEIVDGVNAR